MKRHHLLAFLILSFCTYAAKEIVAPGNYYSAERQEIHKAVAAGKSTSTTGILTGTGSSALPDMPEEIAYTPNSIKDLKTANPAEEITMIEAPSANQTGNAALTFPIKIPAGRKGMEPELSILYNSEGGNGWMGLNWDLQTEAVMIDTRWGVPRYDPLTETETYSLNGDQLTPVAHRGTVVGRSAEKTFYPRVEKDFNKIQRHGSNPQNYWWEVTDKSGVRHFYGGDPVNGADISKVLTDANGNIAFWGLSKVVDPNGNFVQYHYAKVSDPGIAGGNAGYNIYPDSITYTGSGDTEGKYSVVFIRDRQLNKAARPDISISARWGFKQVTADLLKKIMVRYNGKDIRSYELTYITGEFSKTLLDSIKEFDAAGKLFTAHSFQYYNDIRTGGNYAPLAGPADWAPQGDDIKGDFINPIDLFSDKASLLGGNKSFGGGFGMAITLGPDDEDLALKTNTAGVCFGFNYSKNEGMLALVDINGDGLIDKVYKKGGKLFFRPNRSGPSGNVTFGDIRPVNGINDFSKGETFSGDVGLESHFGIFAGFEYTRTEDITSVYFSDVNGDLLVDLVMDGIVYFNHLDSNGNPTFTTSSGDTPSPINGSSAIDPKLVQNDSAKLEAAITDNPLHDVVRVWKAPFDGTVSITAPVALVQDTTPDGKAYLFADGVRVAIQHNGSELWSADIVKNDFAVKEPNGVGAIHVQQGDKIYFRVQSKNNGAYDQVLWAPEITYNNPPANPEDANGLPVYTFSANKDFLLSNSFSTGMSIAGTIHISGNFAKPKTSDDVTIKIVKKPKQGISTILLQQTLPGGQAADVPVSVDEDMAVDDVLFFSVSSNTNIDWAALQWNPIVYFTSVKDTAVKQLFDKNNKPLLYTYPVIDFQSFNRTLHASLPWIVPDTNTYTISPAPAFNSLFETGNVVFSIKKHRQLIAEQDIIVLPGFPVVSTTSQPVTLHLNKGDSLFFEYYSKDQKLADDMTDPSVTIEPDKGNKTSFSGGLHTLDTSFLFGPLYRHWGQFAYNGNRDRANHPINEADLRLPDAFTNQDPPKIDLKGISSKDSMQSMYDNSGGNQPKNNKFIYLVPNSERKLWLGYDNLTYVTRDTVSSSRMGKDNLLPVNPVSNPSVPAGSGAVGINKVSNTDNFSLAAGVGPFGGSVSFGSTAFVYDFTDMNGDSYPDILSESKVQYTDSRGGLEPTARQFSFGTVSTAQHFSAGFTLGGTFLKSSSPNSKSTPKGAKASKAASQTEASAGITGNFGYNADSTAYAWIDVNGDNLPDRVHRDGMVELNLGYSFLPEEQWQFRGITEGNSINYGGGLSINIGDYSISAGIGLSRTESETTKTLQDMNGDGLPDYIVSVSPLMVAINTGNGFAPAIQWAGANAIHKSISTGESVNGAFTIGISIIPIVPVVKLCINPSFNVSQGADRTSLQFEDIDGDGVADLLQSEEDSKLSVSRSLINRTNKLKKVNRPLGSNFTIDYTRTGNTYGMPNSMWTLSKVEIFDGVPGDGADTMRNTFEYQDGFYDRDEREFYGFGKVITFEHDTKNSDIVYRKTDRKYINDNFYEKGLLRSEVLETGAGSKFTETINTYDLQNVHTGLAGFPALVNKQELFYEGQPAAGKSTNTSYTYDGLGNIISSTDFGDEGTADDVTEVTSYHSIPSKYIMDVLSSVTISGNGQVFRQSATSIDENGNITEKRQYLESGDAAKINIEYDGYGNVTKITRPQNATGQRLSISYEYDGEVQSYPVKITDSYGYTSSASYDVRFGQILSATDINGQKTLYTLDNAGRILTIKGPLEVASGQPFTIAFEYHPDATLPWALTKHFDPSHPANFIETATFCDGLGREIQVKKDAALFSGPKAPDKEVMVVSGTSNYDAMDRTVMERYPITENKGTTGTLNPDSDAIAPVKITYDVLDRVLSTTLPDGTVKTEEYGFGTDRDGATQFKVKETDGNGIKVERFTNVRELLKATKEQYSQGSDIWTSFEYNPVDELLKVTDDRGNNIISTYDRLGRRTSVKHPDAGQTIYQYDLNNNPTQVITGNLQGGQGIKYTYDLERLIKITYPKNLQNNVVISYGAAGADFFRAGRIIKQQDGSGTQEFFYNPLGAIVKNKRVINIPDTIPVTFTTEWTYDTWNRLTGMLYPDGEKLTYNYNEGGSLHDMSGVKSGTTYNYLPQQGYDKFDQRVYMRYGNGTEMTYTYEPDRRRLHKLTARTAANRMMLDNTYAYDKEETLTGIDNNAPLPPSNLMGGKSTYQYTYDDLYRLTAAKGIFSDTTHQYRYSVGLKYDNLFSILNKIQLHEKRSYDDTAWIRQIKTSYNYAYNYDPQGKPHAPAHIGERSFTYDANGNQTGWNHDVSAQNRKITWDEENRIQSLSDDGELFRYTYDASGDRVLKSIGQGQTVSVNGKQAAKTSGTGNYTIYINPFEVAGSGGYTKHFYIEGDRIASKLGESGNGNGGNNGSAGGGNGNKQESFQFYYHADHLGNTAFVTDKTGEVYQHLEYFPSGETFIDEHGNQERTPYLYNGKELDNETGLYYYGARYYDTRTGVWESTDPLWELPDEIDKSPYSYVVDNPINYRDYDGMVKGLKLTFKASKKHNFAEFKRQVLGQEKGLHKLKAGAYLKNRKAYILVGRSALGTALQRKYRKVNKLKKNEAALHEPDQIGGGNPQPTDRGDIRVNSSLGSQWKQLVKFLDAYVKTLPAHAFLTGVKLEAIKRK